MEQKINIAFCAGGTLGHITPALSFINSLSDKYNIFFIATIKDKKYKTIEENNKIKQVYFLDASGVPKKIRNFPKVIHQNVKVIKEIKQILKKDKIKIVIGMGGYISGLTINVANKMNLKTIIHEQNSILGLANKINIKKTDIILTSFKNTKGIKNNKKVKWIGNPRYVETLKYPKSCYATKNHILVTSGTLGSKQINEIICKLSQEVFINKYTLTIVTGKKYYEEVKNKINKISNIQVIPFSNNLLNEISRAGIIISRAGSSTLFEILASKTPAIVIPSPNVTKNHQYYNAKNLSDEGLIKLLEEKDLSVEELTKYLNDITINYDIYLNKLETYKIDNPINCFISELNLLEGEMNIEKN